MLFVSKTCLEAYAEADSGEVAVNQSVVLAIKEVGVADAGVVLVGVVGIQADADGLGILVEIGAVTLNVMRPGNVRAQVDTGNHVGIVQCGANTVAPGEVGEETVVFTPAGSLGRPISSSCSLVVRALPYSLAITGLPRALTEQGIATKFRTRITHAADIVGSHFPHQRQSASAEDTVDEMHSAHRGLPELLALVALDIVARVQIIQTAMGVILTANTNYRRNHARDAWMGHA